MRIERQIDGASPFVQGTNAPGISNPTNQIEQDFVPN
jgi:hypothetical protein